MGLILFIIALILMCILFPIGIIFSILKGVYNVVAFMGVGLYTYLDKNGLLVATGIDMIGNVICAPLFNAILIKKGSKHRFGKITETVSKVLGLNKETNTLTKTGLFFANFLNAIHRDHVELAAGTKTKPLKN